MNQAYIMILHSYKGSISSVHLKLRVVHEFERETSKVYHLFAILTLSSLILCIIVVNAFILNFVIEGCFY